MAEWKYLGHTVDDEGKVNGEIWVAPLGTLPPDPPSPKKRWWCETCEDEIPNDQVDVAEMRDGDERLVRSVATHTPEGIRFHVVEEMKGEGSAD